MTTKIIITPLTCYGDKQKLARVIISLIPPHKTYVERFEGGGTIFWSKPITEVEINF